MSKELEQTALQKARQNVHYEAKYPTKAGWKWRRYKCRECGNPIPYNQLMPHAVIKHKDIWKASEDDDELFLKLFEILPIPK